MNVLDLFSGIGGFSLGLERAGMKIKAFCEIEEYPRQVLSKHWPCVPIYNDVKALTNDTLRKDNIPSIDVMCGGFPCQDISLAGKGAGLQGERSGLWYEYARLIGEVGPKWVIIENVRALLGRGLIIILQNLCALGFDVEWHCIPASALGAHHQRDRIWIVAYADGTGCKKQRGAIINEEKLLTAQRESGRAAQPRVGRGFNGVSSWVDGSWEAGIPRTTTIIPSRVQRLMGLGNAVVPQITELIGKAIMDKGSMESENHECT